MTFIVSLTLLCRWYADRFFCNITPLKRSGGVCMKSWVFLLTAEKSCRKFKFSPKWRCRMFTSFHIVWWNRTKELWSREILSFSKCAAACRCEDAVLSKFKLQIWLAFSVNGHLIASIPAHLYRSLQEESTKLDLQSLTLLPRMLLTVIAFFSLPW